MAFSGNKKKGRQNLVRFPDGNESSVSIKDLSPCPSFDTSSRLSVETFADNDPESSVAEPGREQDVTAPPVVNEPGGGSSNADHESPGDNNMPPGRSTGFRKAPERFGEWVS